MDTKNTPIPTVILAAQRQSCKKCPSVPQAQLSGFDGFLEINEVFYKFGYFSHVNGASPTKLINNRFLVELYLFQVSSLLIKAALLRLPHWELFHLLPP